MRVFDYTSGYNNIKISFEPAHLLQELIHVVTTIWEWLLTDQTSLLINLKLNWVYAFCFRLQLLATIGIDKIYDQNLGAQLKLYPLIDVL